MTLIKAAIILALSAACIAPPSVMAGRSGGGGNSAPDLAQANGQHACFLYKLSVKGKKAGWVSSASKSVEAACQDVGGESVQFSATGASYDSLVNNIGKHVLLTTAPNKGTQRVKDAKSDSVLMDIKPQTDSEMDEDVLCGPEDTSQLTWPDKTFSQGIRVVRPSAVSKVGKNWVLTSYVGVQDDDIWQSKGNKGQADVILTGNCGRAGAIQKMLTVEPGTPIIIDYRQAKKNGAYEVGRMAVLE